MKKSLLLVVAALAVVTANAQPVSRVAQAKAKKVVCTNAYEKFTDDVLVATESDHKVSSRVNKAPATGEAFYKRPAGSMYGGLTSNSYLYYNPYVTVKPYAPTTFVANPMSSYTWNYQVWDTSISGRTWNTVTGEDQITINYAYETDSVPSLTNGVTEFHVGGTLSTGTDGWSSIAGIPDMREWTDSEPAGFALLSPKYFGKRDGNTSASVVYTGAADADGGTSGYWFGKNYSGWNAMITYLEKPENPYVIRSAFVKYAYLELNDAVEEGKIYVELYKVASREVESADGMDIKLGERIAAGSGSLVKGEAAETGLLEVFFEEEIDGLVFEVTPTIDDEVAVVVYGYEDEAFNNFSMSVAGDKWDEGHGQHGYMCKRNDDGTISRCYGLDSFFNGVSWASTSPSVFFDVLNPFMVVNYTSDKGVRDFDKEGNCTTAGINTTSGLIPGNICSIYSWNSCEEMTATLKDGSDLPEWLSVSLEDIYDENEEFSGEVKVGFACQPNAGAPRTATVRLTIPGAILDLIVNQEGEGKVGDLTGDGEVNVADVTALVNLILNGGSATAADINGDGEVNVADVTALVNLILAGA